jgi:hypothetical protein
LRKRNEDEMSEISCKKQSDGTANEHPRRMHLPVDVASVLESLWTSIVVGVEVGLRKWKKKKLHSKTILSFISPPEDARSDVPGELKHRWRKR